MNKEPTDLIWAYLHGELSDAEREAFLQALDGNQALEEELRQDEWVHLLMESVLRGDDVSDEELIRHLREE